jgi:hypothetical protein
MPEGGWHMVLRKDKVEIGNSSEYVKTLKPKPIKKKA